MPQRRNSTVWPPRSCQSWMPPWSTGRASTPLGGEDARGDRRTRAGVADRHDRLLADAVVADARAAGTGCGACPRCSRRRARPSRARRAPRPRRLRAARSTSSSSIGASALVARRIERVAGDVEQRDRAQAARRALRLVLARRVDRRSARPATSRNALFVENDEPSTGTLIAPCACPAANESASRTSRIVAPSAFVRALERRAARRRTARGSARRCAPCSAGAAASRRRTPRRSPPRSRSSARG